MFLIHRLNVGRRFTVPSFGGIVSFLLLFTLLGFSAAFAHGNPVEGMSSSPSLPDEITDATGQVCGTLLYNDGSERAALERTAREKPELYRRMVADAKNERNALASVGDQESFYVLNRITQSYDVVEATLVFDGRLARIWLDVSDTARVKASTYMAIAKGLDSTTGSTSRNPAKGIVENDIDVFGETPKKYEVGGKNDFLLTDIQDGLSGGAYVAGYFSQNDQSSQGGSNQRNILYIDSRQGVASGTTSLLNTVAHEFQHLIHFNTNPSSEVFFNEGCSEEASILCGYKTRSNTGYLANTNVSFLYWNYNNSTKLLSDYERALTFVHYLREQYGEAFLTAFTHARTSGMGRINQALTSLGGGGTYQTALMGFTAANYIISGFNDDRFKYVNKISSNVAKVASTYDTLLPATGSVSMQNYGASYILYKNSGPISITFTGSRDFRVMAILYNKTTPIDVVTLEGNTPYTLNSDGSATSIVFGVVNLASATQTVSWQSQKIAASVEGADATTGATLSVEAIIPTPTTADASVAFTMRSSSPVTIELYDVSGRKLSTILDGETFNAGSHRVEVGTAGLPNGIYLVRLRTRGATASRVMVVAR